MCQMSNVNCHFFSSSFFGQSGGVVQGILSMGLVLNCHHKHYKLLNKPDGVAPLIADPPPLMLHQKAKIHSFSKIAVTFEPLIGF